MILSHKYKFIYIKTYKTASTSMEAALSAICGPDDVITPASKALMHTRVDERAQNYRLSHPEVPKRPLWRKLLGRPERHYHPTVGFYEHMPAWRVKAYIEPEIWESYFKFTFERNPWDRQVSWYYYKTKSKADRPSFDDFNSNKKRAWVENYDLYTLNNEPCMDFIGRYENLHEDFDIALDKIGIKGLVSLPHANKSADKTDDYRKFYTQDSIEMVRSWYQPEIKLFDYHY